MYIFPVSHLPQIKAPRVSFHLIGGTYKVRNEIETKRNEINENETKRNEINKNETKRNEINEMKTK